MKILLFAALVSWAAPYHLCAGEGPPALSAQQIMKKVAENQDREEKARATFIYEEDLRVASRYTNGKLAREERTGFFVTPRAKGVDKKRTSVQGRYWHKGRYIDYAGDPIPGQESLDGQLTSGFAESLMENDSKDSLSKDLFPLTTEEQRELAFEVAGEKPVDGRPAYIIRFTPKDRSDIAWAGEALIDKEEFQPVSVYTRLSRRLPFLVRTMLGTDVPGLGFNVRYIRVDKDVWFPATFGTEFRIRAVFFFNRNVSVSMENRNFKRASAESQIHYEEARPK